MNEFKRNKTHRSQSQGTYENYYKAFIYNNRDGYSHTRTY